VVHKVRIPTIDANIEDVALTAWLRREGESVRKGEALAELTTSKAAFELESPCAGVLRARLAREKSTLPIGFVIALVGAPADPLPDVTAENERIFAAYRRTPSASSARDATPSGLTGQAPRARATPAARRLARELGVDLAAVKPAAHDAAVTEQDVRRHAGKDRA
jgi:pyruvate/2-oxoglutarate dehydrogenase complex dihydrolipoamide acyltransferase (E2) component